MATVDRVLPWRRQANAAGTAPARDPEAIAGLLASYRRRFPRADGAIITRAYDVAAQAHLGQMRSSGDAYITHPLAVAAVVADLGLDEVTIAAALLHDAVEDTGLDLDEVGRQFGPEVAGIVDGVTKLDRLRFDSKEAQQAATMRKMLVAMAKDWRVLIIKLADRLHNMRTLAAMPEWKQQRTAQETLDIYAPLAHRLGISEIKWQMEDLSFATLYPKRYAEIEQMVATRAPEREIYLTQVIEEVRQRLAEANITAEVTGRPKHLWSIYEKMVVKNKEFDDIFDLVGIRILIDSDKECWASLGAVHAIWSPVSGRFKDYINTPKFNLYQSLHTTVVGPQGKPLEVQIRTRAMHQRSEFGIAAHWDYKEGTTVRSSATNGRQMDNVRALRAGRKAAGGGAGAGGSGQAPPAHLPGEMVWLQRMVDWQKDTPDPVEFLETLKLDLDQGEVYVFTPKGKVITLPTGGTPIDFAYAIHTEVGHRCIGARANGRLVPLDSQLHSGDTVEIFTSKVGSAGPSRDWLSIAASPRARSKIRQWFSRERREDAIETGREELVKALRREGLPVQKLAASSSLASLAQGLNYADVEALYAALGENHISARSVAQRLGRDLRGGGQDEQLPATARPHRRPGRRTSPGVYVEGLDDVMIRLSKCCTPVPGDQIIGFVTLGRGVSVHRADCANAVSLSTGMVERLIEVEWDRERSGVFAASIELRALDRTRLLADVTKVLSEHHLNILTSSSTTGSDRVSRMRFEFELADPAHLDSVLGSLRRLDSVYDAYRVLPGRGPAGA
ncbi:MAG: RelA/SpoT family protein [Acidimicrobiales bacterium]